MTPAVRDLVDAGGITVEEAEDRVLQWACRLTWSNLTRPLLDQLTMSPTAWRSVADIAMTKTRTNGAGQGAEWGVTCAVGHVRLRINPKGGIRCGIAFQSGPSTVGPNETNGRDLHVCDVTLPETVMMSARGRRLDQILDSEQILSTIPGSTLVRSVRGAAWGLKITLDLPYIQPSRADIEAMRSVADEGGRVG